MKGEKKKTFLRGEDRRRALDLANTDLVYRQLSFPRGEEPLFVMTYSDLIHNEKLLTASFQYRHPEYSIENIVFNDGYCDILRRNGLLLEEPQFMLKIGFGGYDPKTSTFAKEALCLTAGGVYVLLADIARVSYKVGKTLDMYEGVLRNGDTTNIPPRYTDEWKKWITVRFNTIKETIGVGVTEYGDWGILIKNDIVDESKGEDK